MTQVSRMWSRSKTSRSLIRDAMDVTEEWLSHSEFSQRRASRKGFVSFETHNKSARTHSPRALAYYCPAAAAAAAPKRRSMTAAFGSSLFAASSSASAPIPGVCLAHKRNSLSRSADSSCLSAELSRPPAPAACCAAQPRLILTKRCPSQLYGKE